MKVYYKKRNVFKLFEVKIFDLTTDYFERSSNSNNGEDDFQIDLNGKIIEVNQ